MGMDRLEKAVTDLEQRIELLEEVLALVVYREEEAKKAEAELIRKIKEQQDACNVAAEKLVRSFTLNLNTKEGE
ncbi:hypothetical protein [Novosphingobium clariflavum]|uniref:Uncharacterized protein n=1 Tax=Novosphingobium clariflavum TaxID=2029884 RepID=A0ABV6S2F9_9SPHN|nr:hypothetical protein [Novosphingobium clariflavum]